MSYDMQYEKRTRYPQRQTVVGVQSS